MAKEGSGRAARRTPEFEEPILQIEEKIAELKRFAASTDVNLTEQIEQLTRKSEELKRRIFAHLTPWQRVLIARHPERPQVTDILDLIADEFIELHGDRAFRDDPCILTGFARIGGVRCMVIGHRKGKNTKEKLACGFGCAHPEGYRKAIQKMRLAAKLRLPVVSVIDTPGAHPGMGAEERGQAFVIALALKEMADLPAPIICLVLGEGGSGGALGIGVGDRILMLEHAYYSVISPEGCAAILWKDAQHAPDAAEALKLTADDLLGFGVIDEILPEPLGGAHRDVPATAETIKKALLRHLGELENAKPGELVALRFDKFRRMGRFLENVER
ncbi:MAG TPA: acetyl-CoA carboxylase carboxyl transferase subunit alpha [Planctomycetes bacterium]|nr:acetyl-CoA carboxylase carboxyl transferase subunit alpha [Planctomycetota bacterium]